MLSWFPPAVAWPCDFYAPEVPGNTIDEDCDGRLTVHRPLVSAFAADASEWLTGGSVTMDGDAALLDASGGVASITYGATLPWQLGQGHLHAEVSLGGNACALTLQQVPNPPQVQPLADGLNDLVLSLAPLTPIQLLDVACTGPGTTVVDWLTLGNGSYAWPPAADLELQYSDAQFPGGGTLTTVALDANAVSETLYVGSDVGGFAVSFDGFTWETRNGQFDDLVNDTDLAVWAIAHRNVPPVEPGVGEPSLALDPVFILTGDQGGGALWRTVDDGLDWELLSRDVGGAQFYGGPGDKSLAAGKLLLDAVDNLYVASQLPSGFTTGTDRHGVFVLDSAEQLCEPFTGLPQDLDPANRGAYIPTALAELTAELAGVPWRELLVGYRVTGMESSYAVNGGAAVYRCTMVANLDACSQPPVPCAPVPGTEGWDVRDIETFDDPAMTDGARAYVVDGGWRWYVSGSAGGNPIFDVDRSGEGTVQVIAWDSSGSTHPWDSDGDAVAEPDWLSGTGATFADQCATAHAGNLTPTSWVDDPTQLVGLAISPLGDALFAFYHATSGQTNYGCPRVYHADPAVSVFGDEPGWAAADDLYWEPFQGEQSGTDYDCGDDTCNNIDRRGFVDGAGHWPDDQPLREVFAPSYALDAAFVELDLGGPSPVVSLFVNDGRATWAVPPAQGIQAGWSSWDGIAGDDLDEVPWYSGFDGAHAFETTVVNEIATCHGCGETWQEGEVFAALFDLGGARVFTGNSLGLHRAAEWDCHWDGWNGLGTTVAVGEGEVDGQPLRVVLQGTRSTESTASAQVPGTTLQRSPGRGLHWSIDGGDTFCHDGAELNDRGGYTLSAAADRLYCSDWQRPESFYVPEWFACDPLAPLGLVDTVGVPRDVVVVEPGASGLDPVYRALVTATAIDEYPVVDDGNGTLDAQDLALAGLFVASYDPATADTAYVKVGNWTDVVDSAGRTCEAWEFFNGAVEIAVLPDTAGDHFHVLLAGPSPRAATYAADQPYWGYVPEEGEPCGVREVTWDAGYESLATWRHVDLDDAACALPAHRVQGAAVPVGSLDALVYGSYSNGDGGICRVDLAGTYDPVAATYPHEQVVAPDDARLNLADVMPHPHVDGVSFYGGYVNSGDPDTACYVPAVGYTWCTTPALTLLERRATPAGTAWARVPVEEDSVLHKRFTDLDWSGEDASGDPRVETIWVATAGGGVFDAAVGW